MKAVASSTPAGRIPVLSAVKLIAEPWDVGPSGYQVSRLPSRLGRGGTTNSGMACAVLEKAMKASALAEFARRVARLR